MTVLAKSARVYNKIPIYVFLAAGLLALLKAAPILRAQAVTPDGWRFSGILSNSPDLMQYRVWMRQAINEGPLLTNRFTAEPNRPHMLILYYALLGKIAQVAQVAPEFVYSYSGVVLTFVFVILLYLLVRLFIDDRVQAGWIFAIILLAGGLETHLGILSNIEAVRSSPIIMNSLIQGLWSRKSFTDYRGNFLFNAMLDSHYIVNWLMLTLAVMALYFALRRFSLLRLALAVLIAAACTLLHFYEGINLLAIAAVLAGLLWFRKLLDRPAMITLAAVSGVVLTCLGLLYLLQARSDLPVPDWIEEPILFSTIILAFPLVWLLMLIGFGKYWKDAGFDELFLCAWAAGCLLLILAGPFYPYPNRGAITLQIPLYLIAGQIFFQRWLKMTWWALAMIVILVLPMALVQIKNQVERSTFRSDQPAAWLSPAHQQLTSALIHAARQQDLLIADMSQPEWQGDLLWLGPEYPGRFYCGHFFLCPGFKQKRGAVVDFYKAGADQQAEFLQSNMIRFIYARADQQPDHFLEIPGVTILMKNPAGTIYEYAP